LPSTSSPERAVLVTGASSGIGEACARRLVRAGWRVYAGVRTRGAAPEGTTEVLLEVTDTASIEAAAGEIDELHGLVNNAGIAIAVPLELLPLDQLRRQLEVNVVGQLAVTRAFLPTLRETRGRIVNVSSISGRSALPFLGAYAASKFALEAISDSLRVELAPFGIRVSVVEPGTIATPIWGKGAALADEILAASPQEQAELYRARAAAFRRTAAERARRGASADAVARAVEHALTARRPRARYLVGRDAKTRARLQRLPTRMRDRLLARRLLDPTRHFRHDD
jgi:NAD(P)-dependent dehydrogenase (short-subunit alcohol dehydrogenase family)